MLGDKHLQSPNQRASEILVGTVFFFSFHLGSRIQEFLRGFVNVIDYTCGNLKFSNTSSMLIAENLTNTCSMIRWVQF